METSAELKSLNELQEAPATIERKKIIDNLTKAQEKGKLLFASTDNFIVAYKDIPKIYRKFDGWSDRHPKSLADHLETKLESALEHFYMDNPQTFQVVEVGKGFILGAQGSHRYDKRGFFSLKSWESARFNKVFSNRSRQPGFNEPVIYQSAVHEAIGHGIVQRELLTDEVSGLYSHSPELTFLTEGIAAYAEYFLSGVDSHNYLRDVMEEVARWKFSGLGKWKLGNLTEEEVKRKSEEIYRWVGGFSISNVFRLKERSVRADAKSGENNAKLNHLSGMYPRGGSFVKYMIDQYGMEAFKKWTNGLNGNNFYPSLEETTGKSLEEIEDGWKKAVLTEEFFDNPRIHAREKKLSEARKQETSKEREQIMALYKKYS